METHDFGKDRFWHLAWYTNRRHPFWTVETTTEIDAPFRVGRSTVCSLPGFRIALVLGRWVGHHPNEQVAILSATGGRLVEEPEALDLMSSSGDPTDWLPEGWTYRETP